MRFNIREQHVMAFGAVAWIGAGIIALIKDIWPIATLAVFCAAYCIVWVVTSAASILVPARTV